MHEGRDRANSHIHVAIIMTLSSLHPPGKVCWGGRNLPHSCPLVTGVGEEHTLGEDLQELVTGVADECSQLLHILQKATQDHYYLLSPTE